MGGMLRRGRPSAAETSSVTWLILASVALASCSKPSRSARCSQLECESALARTRYRSSRSATVSASARDWLTSSASFASISLCAIQPTMTSATAIRGSTTLSVATPRRQFSERDAPPPLWPATGSDSQPRSARERSRNGFIARLRHHPSRNASLLRMARPMDCRRSCYSSVARPNEMAGLGAGRILRST